MNSEVERTARRAVEAWLAHRPMPVDSPLARAAADEVSRVMTDLSMAMTLARMREARRE
jgi:hypothetical protein